MSTNDGPHRPPDQPPGELRPPAITLRTNTELVLITFQLIESLRDTLASSMNEAQIAAFNFVLQQLQKVLEQISVGEGVLDAETLQLCRDFRQLQF